MSMNTFYSIILHSLIKGPFYCRDLSYNSLNVVRLFSCSVFCLVQEMAEAVTKDFGRIDIFVHSLANGPEVTKPLLETSRRGYLATISASSYSFVSLLRHFLPIMNPGKRCFNIFDIHSFRKGNPRIRRWNELSKSCIGERYKSAGF
ncbi:enoyl-[acyl-carrier-protein] reductase [NADH], chloroplastic-like isoform X4 [Zingiber officinale]|uniref:enoyl-[acyl-carrier-protein] reductase [NADH], chloroplastic-like isoform X4 n=2 Tax=Zingiber officinale TaxID=94328 RepID=UPI001C4C41E9|nr:enoyl-[acyl-carrier-protein] reductase [NADH], chloroplastic-like isoform X4 [Zingiber officinale]